ncbi:hypothetical protein CVT26_010413 [Gymnopilus dilepis]|uniref:Uncharacterized protein n=1 Tax=Gymnopilus dilepis TaxID=231916 RepID=A0A409W4P0_9AGAR|nr:hypothetical protein CVT26_010413 [Gymnopilus dilepis]
MNHHAHYSASPSPGEAIDPTLGVKVKVEDDEAIDPTLGVGVGAGSGTEPTTPASTVFDGFPNDGDNEEEEENNGIGEEEENTTGNAEEDQGHDGGEDIVKCEEQDDADILRRAADSDSGALRQTQVQALHRALAALDAAAAAADAGADAGIGDGNGASDASIGGATASLPVPLPQALVPAPAARGRGGRKRNATRVEPQAQGLSLNVFFHTKNITTDSNVHPTAPSRSGGRSAAAPAPNSGVTSTSTTPVPTNPQVLTSSAPARPPPPPPPPPPPTAHELGHGTANGTGVPLAGRAKVQRSPREPREDEPKRPRRNDLDSGSPSRAPSRSRKAKGKGKGKASTSTSTSASASAATSSLSDPGAAGGRSSTASASASASASTARGRNVIRIPPMRQAARVNAGDDNRGGDIGGSSRATASGSGAGAGAVVQAGSQASAASDTGRALQWMVPAGAQAGPAPMQPTALPGPRPQFPNYSSNPAAPNHVPSGHWNAGASSLSAVANSTLSSALVPHPNPGHQPPQFQMAPVGAATAGRPIQNIAPQRPNFQVPVQGYRPGAGHAPGPAPRFQTQPQAGPGHAFPQGPPQAQAQRAPLQQALYTVQDDIVVFWRRAIGVSPLSSHPHPPPAPPPQGPWMRAPALQHAARPVAPAPNLALHAPAPVRAHQGGFGAVQPPVLPSASAPPHGVMYANAAAHSQPPPAPTSSRHGSYMNYSRQHDDWTGRSSGAVMNNNGYPALPQQHVATDAEDIFRRSMAPTPERRPFDPTLPFTPMSTRTAQSQLRPPSPPRPARARVNGPGPSFPDQHAATQFQSQSTGTNANTHRRSHTVDNSFGYGAQVEFLGRRAAGSASAPGPSASLPGSRRPSNTPPHLYPDLMYGAIGQRQESEFDDDYAFAGAYPYLLSSVLLPSIIIYQTQLALGQPHYQSTEMRRYSPYSPSPPHSAREATYSPQIRSHNLEVEGDDDLAIGIASGTEPTTPASTIFDDLPFPSGEEGGDNSEEDGDDNDNDNGGDHAEDEYEADMFRGATDTAAQIEDLIQALRPAIATLTASAPPATPAAGRGTRARDDSIQDVAARFEGQLRDLSRTLAAFGASASAAAAVAGSRHGDASSLSGPSRRVSVPPSGATGHGGRDAAQPEDEAEALSRGTSGGGDTAIATNDDDDSAIDMATTVQPWEAFPRRSSQVAAQAQCTEPLSAPALSPTTPPPPPTASEPQAGLGVPVEARTQVQRSPRSPRKASAKRARKDNQDGQDRRLPSPSRSSKSKAKKKGKGNASNSTPSGPDAGGPSTASGSASASASTTASTPQTTNVTRTRRRPQAPRVNLPNDNRPIEIGDSSHGSGSGSNADAVVRARSQAAAGTEEVQPMVSAATVQSGPVPMQANFHPGAPPHLSSYPSNLLAVDSLPRGPWSFNTSSNPAFWNSTLPSALVPRLDLGSQPPRFQVAPVGMTTQAGEVPIQNVDPLPPFSQPSQAGYFPGADNGPDTARQVLQGLDLSSVEHGQIPTPQDTTIPSFFILGFDIQGGYFFLQYHISGDRLPGAVVNVHDAEAAEEVQRIREYLPSPQHAQPQICTTYNLVDFRRDIGYILYRGQRVPVKTADARRTLKAASAALRDTVAAGQSQYHRLLGPVTGSASQYPSHQAMPAPTLSVPAPTPVRGQLGGMGHGEHTSLQPPVHPPASAPPQNHGHTYANTTQAFHLPPRASSQLDYRTHIRQSEDWIGTSSRTSMIQNSNDASNENHLVSFADSLPQAGSSTGNTAPTLEPYHHGVILPNTLSAIRTTASQMYEEQAMPLGNGQNPTHNPFPDLGSSQNPDLYTDQNHFNQAMSDFPRPNNPYSHSHSYSFPDFHPPSGTQFPPTGADVSAHGRSQSVDNFLGHGSELGLRRDRADSTTGGVGSSASGPWSQQPSDAPDPPPFNPDFSAFSPEFNLTYGGMGHGQDSRHYDGSHDGGAYPHGGHGRGV